MLDVGQRLADVGIGQPGQRLHVAGPATAQVLLRQPGPQPVQLPRRGQPAQPRNERRGVVRRDQHAVHPVHHLVAERADRGGQHEAERFQGEGVGGESDEARHGLPALPRLRRRRRSEGLTKGAPQEEEGDQGESDGEAERHEARTGIGEGAEAELARLVDGEEREEDEDEGADAIGAAHYFPRPSCFASRVTISFSRWISLSVSSGLWYSTTRPAF